MVVSTNIFHYDIEKKLTEFHHHKRIPHIIFHGPPASGKKYILMKFLKLVYGDEHKLHSNVMFVNCAHGKGIKFIRDELKFFAKTNTQGVNFKSIVMLNAEQLTVDAQSAMRRCIEQYSNNTRFFIVIHNKSKLLVPILSRFCEIYVPPFLDANGNPVSLTQQEFQARYDLKSIAQEKQNNISTIISTNMPKKWYMKQKKNTLNDPNHVQQHNMLSIGEKLYEEGYSVQDFVKWVQNQSYWDDIVKSSIGLEYMKVKSEFRCEKLLFLYIFNSLYSSI
jgi:DNA polymerase III delta prime subunit